MVLVATTSVDRPVVEASVPTRLNRVKESERVAQV